jgi:MraZ protein
MAQFPARAKNAKAHRDDRLDGKNSLFIRFFRFFASDSKKINEKWRFFSPRPIHVAFKPNKFSTAPEIQGERPGGQKIILTVGGEKWIFCPIRDELSGRKTGFWNLGCKLWISVGSLPRIGQGSVGMDKIFLSTEEMTVDNKGRVGIPARFMSVLRTICPDQADAVGVMITPDKSIKLMPVPFFEKEIERLSQLNDQVDEERMMLNLLASLAERAPLDKQNRIKLNPFMMKECAIDRDVVIMGSIQYMQIFDQKVWREYYKSGLPQLGAAASRVAKKDEPRPAVQYVINAGEPPAGVAAAR